MVYQVQEISQFLLEEEKRELREASVDATQFLLQHISDLYYILKTKITPAGLRLYVTLRTYLIKILVNKESIQLIELPNCLLEYRIYTLSQHSELNLRHVNTKTNG